MTSTPKPRLRFFESAANQQHIEAADRYIYRKQEPQFQIAVIGTGTMGQEHMRVAGLLGQARVRGIFDASSHSMDVAERQFKAAGGGNLICYADCKSASLDPAVDALIICTPNHTHRDILQAVQSSGKPILLEKPMATSLADAAAIVELAASYDSFIQLGLQYRYKAQYIEAFHEALARKSLGNIKTISMQESRPPFLDKVGQWNKFNANSGGTLLEKCCHYFDLINLMAEARPLRVYASGGQAVNFLDLKIDGEQSDIDDHAFVIIEYENGIRASFSLNMFSPDFYEDLVVVGEHARLVASENFSIHRQGASEARFSLELGERGVSRSGVVTYPSVIEQSGHHGATYFEHIAFCEQLRGAQVDAATVQDGLWSMIVACAAQASMQSKNPVLVEEFLQQQGLEQVWKEHS